MSLPDAWVDRLFERLTVRYGSAFTAMYRDVDPNLVKGDWSVALAGFSKEALAYGLDNLPPDRPPNASQFRNLCRGAPQILPPALPAPKVERDRVEAALSKIGDKPKHMTQAEQVIDNLSKAAECAKLTAGQRHVLDCCLAMVRERS